MRLQILDDLIAQYREGFLGAGTPDSEEMARFNQFLLQHGGLRKLEVPGRKARLLDRIEALRCFHFSQYLDWYLSEKLGVTREQTEAAHAAMARFNAWLLEREAITQEAFEENQGSILGGDMAGAAADFADDHDDEEEALGISAIPEERDFYVPGEYSATLSGEFTLTKVQEGILYGVLPDGGREIGPILVDRAVSSGHKVGDRVHLSLGKAGSHWNLLNEGQRRS